MIPSFISFAEDVRMKFYLIILHIANSTHVYNIREFLNNAVVTRFDPLAVTDHCVIVLHTLTAVGVPGTNVREVRADHSLVRLEFQSSPFVAFPETDKAFVGNLNTENEPEQFEQIMHNNVA